MSEVDSKLQKWAKETWTKIRPHFTVINLASVFSAIGTIVGIALLVIDYVVHADIEEASTTAFISFFIAGMTLIGGLSHHIKTAEKRLQISLDKVKEASDHAWHGIHLELMRLEPHLANILTDQMSMLRTNAEQLQRYVTDKECRLSVDSTIRLLTDYTDESDRTIEATTVFDVSSWYESQQWYDYRQAQKKKIKDAKAKKHSFSIVRIFPLTDEELKDDRIRINMQLQAEYGIDVRLYEVGETKPRIEDFVMFDGRRAIEIVPEEETGPHGERRFHGYITCKREKIRDYKHWFGEMARKTMRFSSSKQLMNYRPTEALTNLQKLLTCIEETLTDGNDVYATNISDIRALQSEMYELLFLLNQKILQNNAQVPTASGKRAAIRRIFAVEKRKLAEDLTLRKILKNAMRDNLESGIEVYVLCKDDPATQELGELKDFFVGHDHFLFINHDPGFGYEDFSKKKFEVRNELPSRNPDKNILISKKLGGKSEDIESYYQLLGKYMEKAIPVTRQDLDETFDTILKG